MSYINTVSDKSSLIYHIVILILLFFIFVLYNFYFSHFFRSLHNLESSATEPTAKWTVPLSDGNHVVEFEHGTATGRRIVKIDGDEIVHRDWMFRLVGDEVFMFNNTKFVIRVDPMPGRVSSSYRSLTINVLFYSIMTIV